MRCVPFVSLAFLAGSATAAHVPRNEAASPLTTGQVPASAASTPAGSSGQGHTWGPWSGANHTRPHGPTSVSGAASTSTSTSTIVVSAPPTARSDLGKGNIGCVGTAIPEKLYVGTCFNGDHFLMSGADCFQACDCQDWGMNCLSPNLDCADSEAVREFCRRQKPEFTCSCPGGNKRDVEAEKSSMSVANTVTTVVSSISIAVPSTKTFTVTARSETRTPQRFTKSTTQGPPFTAKKRDEDVPPSAPLRPTSVTQITVTRAPFSAPLRPTSIGATTVTTHAAPAARSQKYQKYCYTGNDVVLGTYSAVCADGKEVTMTIQKDCNETCVCDSEGNLKCNPGDCGNSSEFETFCRSSFGLSWSFRRCTTLPGSLEGRTDDCAAEVDSHAPESSNNDSPTTYEAQCSGPDMQEENFAQVCENGFLLPLSGDGCQKLCHCDEEGTMSCDSPAAGCPESFYEVTHFCTSETSSFACSCEKATKHNEINARALSDASSHTNMDAREVTSMTCSGADMTTKQDVGVCMDGNFLSWSGNDCAKYCDCDGDSIDCHPPSDCGPVKDVNAACAIGPNYTCQCRAKRDEVNVISSGSPEPAVEAREPSADQANAMTCTGSDTTERFDTGVVCADGNTLHWSGDTCSQYCSCSNGQVHCDAPSDCGPESQLSAWCAVGPNFKFKCDCSAQNQERDEPATTKKSATVTQPNPVLSYTPGPTTLPQITPPHAVGAQSTQQSSTTRRNPAGARLESRATSEVQCSGKDINAAKDLITCPADFYAVVNAYDCRTACECNDQGQMECSGGYDACGGGLGIRVVCDASHPEWSCSCNASSTTTAGAEHSKRDIILTIETDPKPVQHEVASPMAPMIGNSNNYALVCNDDKLTTAYCQGFSYQFYCTDKGKVQYKGEFGEYSDCDDWCRCQNLQPKPYCYLGYTAQYNCIKKRDDGSDFLTYHSRDEIEALEARDEAIVLRDLDTFPSHVHDLIMRDAPEVLSPRANEASVVAPKPATTLSTVSAPKRSLAARDPPAGSPDFDFYCKGPDMEKNINLGDAGHCPSNIGIYLDGHYCSTHCTCDNDGCVICNANEPEGIDKCGGNDAANNFCRADRKEFACDYMNHFGARSGCQH
ncbi:hypothetical protein PMZ80_008996 [Knufia obscura]|uniref:Uncharacterized protein n=1 Tax=Knufia obscura TaxID=1635080 RepID=A0ABR0RDU9_9EURO|nr:hypothetical protein PMZ80_008996 [Knufia obscura]